MQAHYLDWLALSVRWLHFIVGIAWIGASFYFVWLENHLIRGGQQKDGNEGYLWALHGGGVYHLEKLKSPPIPLPEPLHWFKWEAYWTFISGFSLLILVYYFNASAYLVDSSIMPLGNIAAIVISLAFLAGGWFVYHLLCDSALKQKPIVLAIVLYVLMVLAAYALTHLFAPRAAFLHLGAMIGGAMVANVFFVIMPGQRKMIAAAEQGQAPDPAHGKRALLRSRHNNYLTLPVLFMMISNHYPGTYGHTNAWLIAAGIIAAGALIRHYFNAKVHGDKAWPWFAAGAAIMLLMAILTQPQAPDASGAKISMAEVRSVMQQHCQQCHSASPTDSIFVVAPAGVMLDNDEQIHSLKERIYQRAVVDKSMPFNNQSGMTDAERELLGRWYAQNSAP